jgi:DNA polymerase-3 subunit gamma/tau
MEDLQRLLTLLIRTEAELAVSSFPRLTLEMALLRLTHLPPTKDVSSLLRKIDDLERRLAGFGPGSPGPAPSGAGSSEGPEEPPGEKKELTPDPGDPLPAESLPVSGDGRSEWAELVRHVRRQRPRIGTVLEHGRLIRLELPVLELGFTAGSFHQEQMKDPETVAIFQGFAEEFFHQPVTVRVVSVDGEQEKNIPPSLVEERQSRATDRKQKVEQEIRAHPLVKAVQEILNGEIVEIKPLDQGSE